MGVSDEMLLTSIINYLGCGVIEKVDTRPNEVKLVVYKFNDICEKIIYFFTKYPLQGVKYLNFADFCKIANLMISKSHLTKEGIEEIRLIKSQMNSSRIYK